MDILNDPGLMRLLTKIYDDKGLDFTQYKDKTLLRRIYSRMHRCNLDSYDEYLNILETNSREYDSLINALTINVTDFFRNPESFEAIAKTAIPGIVYAKMNRQHKIIRAWSCGCSKGDEPFSLAMLFLEKLGRARDRFLLTIKATDIDKSVLLEAPHKIYSIKELKAVDTKLLAKYFEPTDNGEFTLKKTVKDIVRFKQHDIIKDRPFLHCDIILCRNLLIYFNKQLQEEILLKFYGCLNPGGFLVLGMVESLQGAALNVFEHVDDRLRIYRRPERQSLQYKGEAVLVQDEIDTIVNQMFEA